MSLEMWGPLLALVGPGYEGQSFAPKTCFTPSAQSRVFQERAVICDPLMLWTRGLCWNLRCSQQPRDMGPQKPADS